MIKFKDFIGDKLKKAACVAIFNSKNQILLLRRSDTAEWMPFHYCFPGGHVEKKEKPIDAAVRETFEETQIELEKNKIKLAGLEENNGFVNYIFVTSISDSEIILNFEHDKYIWCSFEKCQDYKLVPNLYNFIKELKNKGYFK